MKKTYRAFVGGAECALLHSTTPSGAARKGVTQFKRKNGKMPKTIMVEDITKSDSHTKGRQTTYAVSVKKLDEPVIVKRGDFEMTVKEKVILKKT